MAVVNPKMRTTIEPITAIGRNPSSTWPTSVTGNADVDARSTRKGGQNIRRGQFGPSRNAEPACSMTNSRQSSASTTVMPAAIRKTTWSPGALITPIRSGAPSTR
jgi:hypothetical protein